MSRDPFEGLIDALTPKDVSAEVFEAIGYVPTPKQAEFHAATERDVLYGGAAGGGKSAALVADMLAKAMQWPGIRIAAFRRTYDELNESLIKELGRVAYAEALGGKWNATDRELRFGNGSLIRFRYAETVVDASRRQGGEFQYLALDELTLFAPGVVDLLRERLRSGNSAVPVIGVRSTSNPGGATHAQVKARYIDATDYGRNVVEDAHGTTVRFIPAKVTDNPHIDPTYAAQLAAIPDENRRKALLDGSWDVFSGMYWPEWNRDRHVVQPFEVPSAWKTYVGIDWGYAAPWAAVYASLDEDRRLWLWAEDYGTRVGEADQAKAVLRRLQDRSESRHQVYADDACWASRGSVKSIADTWRDSGLFAMPAHKGERLSGWTRIRTYLGEAPACPLHRQAGWETCPMLHVFNSCVNFIRTFPSLCYDPRKVEDLDTTADDHMADALRYLIVNLRRSSAEMWLNPVAVEEEDPYAAQVRALRDPFAQSAGWDLPDWRQLYYGDAAAPDRS